MKLRNYLLTINTNVWWKANFSVYMTLLLYLSPEESFLHWPVVFNIAKLNMHLKNKKFSKPIKIEWIHMLCCLLSRNEKEMKSNI